MGILNAYNKGLDTLRGVSNRFDTLLFSDKAKVGRVIGNSILTILVLLLFGCFDFVNWGFSLERILTIEYWTTIVTKVSIAVCCFNIGININWAFCIEKAIDLLESITLYDILIKQKDDDNFDYYVNHVFNPKLKRRAYINKINKKIHLLNRFSKDNDIELYSKKIPSGVPNYDKLVEELEYEKAHNKYCIRRKQLEYLKSEEYINENLESLGVRYSRVDASLFNLGIDGKNKNEKFEIRGNVLVGRAKQSSNVVLSMLIISMFTTSLVISINQQQFEDQMRAFWYYLCTCLIDAGLVIWNIFRGTRAVNPVINEQLTLPYSNRNTLLKKYIAWKEESKIGISTMQQKINELIDEENNTVEMSAEDYKKYLNNKDNKV